jgi:hypothetical protein
VAIGTLLDFTYMGTFECESRIRVIKGLFVDPNHIEFFPMVFTMAANTRFAFGKRGGM